MRKLAKEKACQPSEPPQFFAIKNIKTLRK